MKRGTYALRACDYCDMQLPGNELFAVTDRVVSGTRQGSRSYFSSRGTAGSGSSHSTYYRINHLKICQDCYEQRAARIRRQQFRDTIRGIAYVIGIVIGGAIIVSFFRHSGTAPANTIENAATSIVGDDGNTVVPDNQSATTVAASDNVAVEDNAMAVSQPTTQAQVTDQTGQIYQRPEPVMRAPAPRDEFARAINDATSTLR